ELICPPLAGHELQLEVPTQAPREEGESAVQLAVSLVEGVQCRRLRDGGRWWRCAWRRPQAGGRLRGLRSRIHQERVGHLLDASFERRVVKRLSSDSAAVL